MNTQDTNRMIAPEAEATAEFEAVRTEEFSQLGVWLQESGWMLILAVVLLLLSSLRMAAS